MARKVNQEEYATKRNEILDEVQTLIYTKGYEQMTIQDILDRLQISKGAFYHYFDSKQALLVALLDRIIEQMRQMLEPIVKNPDMNALEKLQHFISSIASWKTARRSMLMGILRIWYHDDNAIVRQKMRINLSNPIVSLMNEVIQQGLAEGTLKPTHPKYISRVAFSLMQDLGDTVALELLAFDPEKDDMEPIKEMVHSYIHTIEMVLGAPEGSLPLFPDHLLDVWFLQQDEPEYSE